MKNYLLIGAVCLGLGFAAGRLSYQGNLKDSENQQVRNSRQTVATKSTPQNRSKRDVRTGAPSGKTSYSSGNSSMPSADEQKEIFHQMNENRWRTRDNWLSEAIDNQVGKFDIRLTKLSSQLELNAAQQQNIKELLEAQIKDIVKEDTTQGLVSFDLDGKKLADQLLADIMTDEQKIRYEALKERERESAIDSKALQNLAGINKLLDLNDDQKDNVYEILHKRATKTIDKPTDQTGGYFSMTSSGDGVEVVSDTFGIGQILDQQRKAIKENGTKTDSTTLKKMATEGANQNINIRLAELSSVLDDSQIEQYRKHLTTQANSIIGNMVMDFGSP